MGLCENVYRRGGVYWFRRRLRLVDSGPCSYIRVSLKVRDPRRAREIARLVGAEADRLRKRATLNASQQKALLKAFIAEQAGRLDGVARIVAHQDADNAARAEPPNRRGFALRSKPSDGMRRASLHPAGG